jgi:hypothetical protein
MKRANLRYTVPGGNPDVLEWFGDRFEAVFAAPSPFVRVSPEHRPLFEALEDQFEDGPTRKQLRELGIAVRWSEVIDLVDLPDRESLNVALLNSSLALRSMSPEQIRGFEQALEDNGIVAPEKGELPAVLVDTFFGAIREAGYSDAIVGNEFGDEYDRRQIGKWLDREFPWVGPAHATIRSPDVSVLFGVHWDSYFTFACGPRAFIDSMVSRYSLEGFYFGPRQTVYWHMFDRIRWYPS